MARKWEAQDIKFLEDNYLVLSHKEIAEKLGRRVKGISSKLDRLGLYKNNNSIKGRTVRTVSEKPKKPVNEKLPDGYDLKLSFCNKQGFKTVSEAISYFGSASKFNKAYRDLSAFH